MAPKKFPKKKGKKKEGEMDVSIDVALDEGGLFFSSTRRRRATVATIECRYDSKRSYEAKDDPQGR